MNSTDAIFLLKEIKRFENHFMPLEFRHLATFSKYLRGWTLAYRKDVVDVLVYKGLITNTNGFLQRVS